VGSSPTPGTTLSLVEKGAEAVRVGIAHAAGLEHGLQGTRYGFDVFIAGTKIGPEKVGIPGL